MFILNADPHGNYNKIENFCYKIKLTNEDTIILLGDVAFNYFGDKRDNPRKERLSNMPCNFLCIHGNHEMRPQTLSQYKLKDFNGGKVFVDENYPNVMFAKDGEIYNLNGFKCIAIGGAYSVDKMKRLAIGANWFEDEQPSEQIKQFVESQLENNNWKIDYVFTHTCPIMYEPREVFLKEFSQKDVDKTTEMWLGNIEYRLQYKRWYIGHFHTDKIIDKMRFLFDDFIELGR